MKRIFNTQLVHLLEQWFTASATDNEAECLRLKELALKELINVGDFNISTRDVRNKVESQFQTLVTWFSK